MIKQQQHFYLDDASVRNIASARGTHESAGKYWQAKHAAAQVVTEAKTQAWEDFGEAMEEDYRLAAKKFWQTVQRLRKGKQCPANTAYSRGWELLASTWGYYRAVERLL